MLSQPIFPVLHPRHKLAYFRKVKWLKRWIKAAETLMHDEFEYSCASSYHNIDIEMIDNTLDKQEESANVFDNLEALAPPKLSDLGSELDRYLSLDVEHITDALAWWYKRHEMFPCLSKMALDYLSVPGTPTLLISYFIQLIDCSYIYGR